MYKSLQKCNLVKNIVNFIFELVKLNKFSSKGLTLFDSIRREVVVSDGEASTPSLRTLMSYSMDCDACYH